MSKNTCAFGRSTSSGIDARKMPTAPRSPTQEMNAFSRHEKRNGARHRNTASGRAKNISVAATASAGPMLEQTLGPREQAEQHEHDDLRQPGGGIEEDDDRIVRAGRPVADDHPGEIDGEKARRVEDLGQREHDERAGGDQRRMQALRQGEAIERRARSRVRR